LCNTNSGENDLKHGAAATGAIGLFVDVGTEGYFRDVKISSLDGTSGQR
jgi:hypothetical protein